MTGALVMKPGHLREMWLGGSPSLRGGRSKTLGYQFPMPEEEADEPGLDQVPVLAL